VSTLFIVGDHDEAPPATAGYYQSVVPHSELVVIPDAHNRAVREALAEIESSEP
jgi:pimeloyl-ACP methyl ester carboxylesterase